MSRPPIETLRRFWRVVAPVLAAGLLGLVCWLAWRALPPGDTFDAVRNWPALWAAAVAYLVVILLLPVIWVGLLRSALEGTNTTQAPGLSDLYSTYSRSWLARYIPGRVWTYGGRAVLAARLGVPVAPVARSMVLEILFSYGMLTVLGAGLLAWATAGAVVGISCLCAGTLALGLGIRLLRRASGVSRFLPARLRSVGPDCAGRAAPLAWPLAAYAGHGMLNLAFFVFCALAFLPLTPTEIVHVAGAWGIAMTLGWLAFIAPGGLGARDGVALLFLAPLVDAPTAALIVAAARVLSIVLDFLFVGLVEATLFLRRLRQPSASLPHIKPENLP